jgi:beta-phosphoglucomutase-like phosphatase (HAD superfamily)
MGKDLACAFSVFAGDVVARKKPAPDIYEYALLALGVNAADAVAVEDSQNGLRAALGAGIPTIVTVSSYTADEDFTGAGLVVDSLGEPPARPTAVRANPGKLTIQDRVSLATLENLRSSQETVQRSAT